MPSKDAHLQFEKWAREYGPIYSLMLGTKCLVVISSDEAVKELLDRRSRIYSHRQDMYIGQTLCSGGLRMLMMVRPRVSVLLNELDANAQADSVERVMALPGECAGRWSTGCSTWSARRDTSHTKYLKTSKCCSNS